MTILKKINFILSVDKKIKFYSLFFITFIVSFLDLIGLSAIFPILVIFTDPNFLDNKYILIIFNNFQFLNENNFLFYSISFLFLIFLIKIVLSTILHIFKYKILWNFYSKINNKLMKNYVNTDYSIFLRLRIFEKTNIVKSEVEYFIMGVIDPFLIIVLEGLTIFLIFIFLILYDPQSTLGIIFSISLIIILLMYFFGKRLKKLGTSRHNLNNFLQQQINHAFHGIKDLKLSSRENIFLKKFSNITNNLSKVMSSISSWQMLPRHVLEFLTIISFILICFFGINSGKNFSELTVMLGLYAAATFRVMPSLNRVIVSYNSIKQTKTVIDKIYADYLLESNDSFTNDEQVTNNIVSLDKIEIKDLCFKFPSQNQFLVKDLSLKIEKGQYIGIYGKSGTGKTTFVDLFSGLLQPSLGSIKLNDKDVKFFLKKWKSIISYVPQKIYLNNVSIRENVAFGNDIDDKKINKCLEDAQLLEFINLQPKKLDTIVGENGINLSGGQIQRLGIARALYRDSQILIFDESTSSLDPLTENDFMKTVNKIKGDRVILFISHKISLLEKCDKVYELVDKKLNLKK